MSTLAIILLAVIAFILWRIYRQREQERAEVAAEKFEAKREQMEKEMRTKYPHVLNKLESNWDEVFIHHAERGAPLLNLAFLLYLGESTKIDLSEGSQKWDTLWDLTEELLEHLETYHEGSTTEHLIAVCAYWQVAAEAVGELVKENPEIEGSKMEVEPYTSIAKITALFPKKSHHPDNEIMFHDPEGKFPRESKGAKSVHDRITV